MAMAPSAISDSVGTRLSYHAYLPFGEEATAINQDAERRKFTSHERDLGNMAIGADDVDYMHARHYSPPVGRFLSTDTVPGLLRRPQTWNRYGYALHNPLNYIDTDGLQESPAQESPSWETFINFLRSHFAANYMLATDESTKVNKTLIRIAIIGGAGAIVIDTFADAFEAADEDGDNETSGAKRARPMMPAPTSTRLSTQIRLRPKMTRSLGATVKPAEL